MSLSMPHPVYFIRGYDVMLDTNVAFLYGVTRKTLRQAVKRNLDGFPNDFAFVLTVEELEKLKQQIPVHDRRGSRYLPYAFTAYGLVMLSSVLRNKRAVAMSLKIMDILNDPSVDEDFIKEAMETRGRKRIYPSVIHRLIKEIEVGR